MKDNQVFCYQTHTTPATHQIVKDHIHLSVHIHETKKGEYNFTFLLVTYSCVGPRYCPSLEAKIMRFGHKDSHVVWLEPEGYESGRYLVL